MSIEKFSLSVKSMKDIKSETTEHGLLIKGLPVFKAGNYRGNPYTVDYIDRNIINQFSPDDDIPLQADHSPSFKDTLGYLRNIYRQGEFLLADVELIDDNAIARWKKGLMKKFSAGIDMVKDKLREVSAVAFPYVKEAAVHTEETITLTEGLETIKIDKPAEKTDEELGIVISFEPDSDQYEVVGITEEEVLNMDPKKDITDYSDEIGMTFADDIEDYAKKSEELPDSAFLLLKKPVKNKKRDRKFPIRDSEGKISLANVRAALLGLEKLKDFADNTKIKAKERLQQIISKVETKTRFASDEKSEDIDIRRNKMSKEIKKDDEVNTLLEEACEKQEALAKEVETKEEELLSEKTKVEELSLQIKTTEVEKKADSLVACGKLTPAQKEHAVSLLLSMSDEQSAQYMELMKDSKPVIDLGETGVEDSEEPKRDGEALDINSLSAPEINAFAEQVAKDNDIAFQDALDMVYDGVIDSNGKKIESTKAVE